MRRVLVWLAAVLLIGAAHGVHAQNMTPGADPGGETTPGTGTVYYVSKSDGSDSDSGLTTGLAWQTITKVNTIAFNPGDTIRFKRGDTWTSADGTLCIDRSGTSGNPIIFGAYGSTGARPKIQGDLMCPSESYVMSGRSWIVMDRLHFDNGDPIIIEDSNNITLQYSEISKRSRACLKPKSNSGNILIQFNKIHDCGAYFTGGCGFDCSPDFINGECLYLGSATSAGNDPTHDVIIRSNEIFACTDEGIDIKPNESNITVEDNILHTALVNRAPNGGMLGAIAIQGPDPGQPAATGVILRRNVIHTWKARSGIWTYGDPTVINNLMYNMTINTLGGVSVKAAGDFYHNTLYGMTIPFKIEGGASGYDIKHNLGPSTANNLAATSGLFVNAAGGNFNLVAGAPAIDLAAVVGGVTSDMLQITRPKGALVDYGAYEYTAGTETPLHLVFTAPPVTTPEDTLLPAVEVCAKDPTNVTDPTFVAAISVAITTNPAAGTLTGGTGGAATAGCRQFSGLSIDNDGVGYQLTAVATGATSIVSPLFNVTDIVIPPPVSAPQALKIPIVQ